MDSDKNTDGLTPVISPSNDSASRRKWAVPTFMSTSKGKLVALGVMLLVIALVGGWIYSNHRSAPRVRGPEVAVKSESAALKQDVQDVQSAAPDDSATAEEKLQYYDKLFYAQTSSEDYKGAVATFEQRKSVSTGGLKYNDYFLAGQAYCKLKDSERARQAFNDVRVTMPAKDDLEAGFSRENMLSTLEAAGKECGL